MAFPTRHRPRTVTAAAAVATSLVGAVSLSACGGDGGAAAGESPATETTQVDGTSDEASDGAADSLTLVTDVPDDEVSDGFVERIVYPVTDGASDPTENWADLYLPSGTDGGTDTEQADSTIPLVVYIQGTGWNGGAHGARHVASDLASRGVAVINIEYRGVKEGAGWPKTFEDVAAALDYVPTIGEHHPQIRVEDSTVVGHSAGGQLATWAASRGDLADDEVGAHPRFSPTRVVSLAGPLDLIWAAENGDDNIVKAMDATPDELPKAYDSIDPIRNINPDVAVVAVHGTDDTLVPQENSEHYVEAARDAGGSAELVLFRGADHLSFLKSSSPHYDRLLRIIHGSATLPHDDLDGDRFTS
ncbi:alpha/beta hydrolase [Corynebacterium sp. USCH3]|uniref:alpha/beta hydrolase family protein n=1 Tax=Corynebacterium sp. USCH3 TaxID=3024840 RepID=UPI00309B90D4